MLSFSIGSFDTHSNELLDQTRTLPNQMIQFSRMLTSLEFALKRVADPDTGGSLWDSTVVITHFAPSLQSADPRFGHQPGTASFCNADDDLLPLADLWLHGHLHCRHDYLVERAGRRPARVVCQARGLASKGEAKRALKEGSISVNKRKVDDARVVDTADLINGRFILLQRGKKNYFLVKVG